MQLRFSFLFVLLSSALLLAAEPKVLDPRLTLELVASEPDIVTPTGIAVDAKGRIWCIENHTHQTAAGYKGPKSDRIRIYEDFDDKGKARKITTFADDFRDAMSLTFSPDGALYLATRSTISRFEGTKPHPIIKLETKGTYPHNGLCGFAWDRDGSLLFGLGENLGESYTLVGADRTTLSGGGEGGSVYRCTPNGGKLQRIATGFWNPFGMALDARGRVFVVDNDPDARGPCRLLHVVQGGDFGYRFRYGRKGTHPFQAWNGEMPGTLPMVAGTSEAPSGIVAADSTSLPRDFDGDLFVTSWGDHTIERFHLSSKGASLSATSKAIIRGDEDFRPVAMAIAPDGAIVFTDWVKKDYSVHGHGRIWRLRAISQERARRAPPSPSEENHSETAWYLAARQAKSPEDRMLALLNLKSPARTREFVPVLADADPYLANAALVALGRSGNSGMLVEALNGTASAMLRLGLLLALRRTGDSEARTCLAVFLDDGDPVVRRMAIQWVAEERLTEFAGKLEAAASKAPVTRELLESYLAARELLDGKNVGSATKGIPGEDFVAEIVKDERRPMEFRTHALRSLRHDHPILTATFLSQLLKEHDEKLSCEVVRILILRPDRNSQELLRSVVAASKFSNSLRALAIVGLAHSLDAVESRATLEALRSDPALKADAARALNELPIPETKRSAQQWRAVLSESGDASAGERVFFHPKGPGCHKCHQVDGRGYAVGPDLTFIARSANRDKLIDSILEPSKEIAPLFTSWRLLTRDGKERIGMIAGETHDSMILFADSEGVVTRIHRTQIEERVPVSKSVMPEDLAQRMTPKEFRDLLEFLLTRK